MMMMMMMTFEHLYYHHFYLLSFAQSFILTLRLGFLANPIHHRFFLHLSYWSHRFCDHL